MPLATQQHLLLTALELASMALPVLRGSDLSVLLGDVAQRIGADAASLARIDLAGRDETAILWPAARAASAPAAFDAYARTASTHPVRAPLLRSVRENRPWTLPIRLSEVATQIAWRGTPLRIEVLRSLTDQVCLPLSYDGTILTAISLGRSGGTFSSRECELLRLVGPHLRAALARTRGTDTLALRLVPTVAWTTACFAPGGAVPGVNGAVPSAARGWSAESPVNGPAGGRAGGPAGGRAEGPAGGRAEGPAGGPAEGLAVSAREGQVLDLVVEGLTDAAIGRRLGLAGATVSKHLQRVYARHGLGNRALATRWWLERRDGG
jgi:DNA-binding CsgD family transcriptional regulator